MALGGFLVVLNGFKYFFGIFLLDFSGFVWDVGAFWQHTDAVCCVLLCG